MFSLIFAFPTSPSWLVSMRPSRTPLLFGSPMAWSRICNLCSPGISWMVYALLCCPCSRYWSEKGPKSGQGLHREKLPTLCRGHLPLALPDQESRNRHSWAPLFTISFLFISTVGLHAQAELSALPQSAVTLPNLITHPS